MIGKIYGIICWFTGEIYIGSTTVSLEKRLTQHKYSNECSSKYIIQRNNYEIFLLEQFKYENNKDLLWKERYYYDSYDCVNINPPITTNDEKLKSLQKGYDKYTKTDKYLQRKKERFQKKWICDK